MTKNRHSRTDAPSPSLRARAEARAGGKLPEIASLSADDVRALVHELQIHQAELEIQNEELRAAQLELAAARDRYADLYEFAPVGYLTVDARRVVREANLTATRLLHVERTQLIGRRLEESVLPDDRDEVYRHFSIASDGPGPGPAEFRVRDPHGDVRWTQFEVTWHEPPTADEGEWRVTLHDVTARKLTEVALHRRTRQFARLADNAPDLIFRIDRQLRHVFVNRRVLEVTGRSWDDYIGRTNRDLGFPAELCDLWDRPLEQAFLTRRTQELEFAYDGSAGRRVFHARIVPEVAPDGNVETVLGIARDVSDRKAAEAERERLVTELREALAAVRTLRSLLPMCASCRRVRDDDGYWQQLEAYISAHTDTKFTHGLCPACLRKLYPDIADDVLGLEAP